MSGQQHLCHYCHSPQPDWICKYCPSYRDQLKMKGDVIRELRHDLSGFQQLQLEHFRLKKQYQRLQQQFEELKDTHYQLRDVYYNQIVMIEELKTTAIENIGKNLISFLFKQ